MRRVGREHDRPQAGARATARRGRGNAGLADAALARVEDGPWGHAALTLKAVHYSDRRMSRTFRGFALVGVALCAAFLSACGGGSSGDVKDTLDKAFSTPIKSATIDLEITLKLDGVKQLNGPVKLSVQGPYESGGSQTIPKADWDIAASAAGQNFSAGFTSTGTNAWVSFQGQNYEVGRQAVAQVNQQIRQAAGKSQKKGL